MDAFPPQLFQACADRREIIGSAGRGHAPPHLLPMDFDFCRAADWLIIGARTSGGRAPIEAFRNGVFCTELLRILAA
jgi:hypothetical protein